MGITSKSLYTLKKFIDSHNPKVVCDLGAQNLFLDKIDPDHFDPLINSKQWIESLGLRLYNESLAGEPETPKPYVSEMWKKIGIEYFSVDVSGLNNSIKWDLSQPINTKMQFDFVMDYGTSEHIMSNYQFFLNCDELTKINGLMIHENPKSGSWPGHGFHYYTMGFYIDLAKKAGYDILDIGENAAQGNEVDGWNVFVVLRKTKEGFINKSDFPKSEPK